MSLGVRGTTGRMLIGLAIVVLAATLALQVFLWRVGEARLRPDPGFIKLGMVLSVLTICGVIVARSFAGDGEVKPEPDSDMLDETR